MSEIEFQYGLNLHKNNNNIEEFPFNLYIGKHMEKPLMIKNEEGLVYSVNYDNIRQVIESNCKPQLKSLESLSDEELIWAFFGDNYNDVTLKRRGYFVYIAECRINLNTGYIHPCDQSILNRLHSLHRSENEKALLEAELIEIVG